MGADGIISMADLSGVPLEHELSTRYWGGVGHVPLRMRDANRLPYTKPSDPKYKQPMLVSDGAVLQLDMGNEGDRNKLAEVMSWQARGAVVISKLEHAFDSNTGNFKVFVMYNKLVYEDPQELVGRIRTGWERKEF